MEKKQSELYVIMLDASSYYVRTICPVVAFETSSKLAKAKLFETKEDVEKEVKENEILSYKVYKLSDKEMLEI